MATIDLSNYIQTIIIWKRGFETMCARYPYQYPVLEKKKKLIKKVERYVTVISKVRGTEDTKEKVIKTLYNYLDPFNLSSNKEEMYRFLMAL